MADRVETRFLPQTAHDSRLLKTLFPLTLDHLRGLMSSQIVKLSVVDIVALMERYGLDGLWGSQGIRRGDGKHGGVSSRGGTGTRAARFTTGPK